MIFLHSPDESLLKNDGNVNIFVIIIIYSHTKYECLTDTKDMFDCIVLQILKYTFLLYLRSLLQIWNVQKEKTKKCFA